MFLFFCQLNINQYAFCFWTCSIKKYVLLRKPSLNTWGLTFANSHKFSNWTLFTPEKCMICLIPVTIYHIINLHHLWTYDADLEIKTWRISITRSYTKVKSFYSDGTLLCTRPSKYVQCRKPCTESCRPPGYRAVCRCCGNPEGSCGWPSVWRPVPCQCNSVPRPATVCWHHVFSPPFRKVFQRWEKGSHAYVVFRCQQPDIAIVIHKSDICLLVCSLVGLLHCIFFPCRLLYTVSFPPRERRPSHPPACSTPCGLSWCMPMFRSPASTARF